MYTHNIWEPAPRPRGLARYCCWQSSRRWVNTHVCVNTSLPTRNDVMGNNENQQSVDKLLLHGTTMDEADIMLSSYMLHAVREGTLRVRILREDTYDCVRFLVCWSWKDNVETDDQFEKWNCIVLRNNAIVISLDSTFEGLLASHPHFIHPRDYSPHEYFWYKVTLFWNRTYI